MQKGNKHSLLETLIWVWHILKQKYRYNFEIKTINTSPTPPNSFKFLKFLKLFPAKTCYVHFHNCYVRSLSLCTRSIKLGLKMSPGLFSVLCDVTNSAVCPASKNQISTEDIDIFSAECKNHMRIRHCMSIIQHSEAQTFNWSSKNKNILLNRGRL